MRRVVITGVSSGIGLGAATIFTQQGCHVFGTGRNFGLLNTGDRQDVAQRAS